MKENLFKKFCSFSVGGYINILIGLFFVPIVTRLISPEEYGIASLIIVIGNLLATISYLGLDLGFMRYFYDEKENNRGRLLFEVIYYPTLMVIIIVFFIFIFREKISFFIIGNKKNLVWIIIALYPFFIVINRFSLLVIRMQQKAKLYSFFNVLAKSIEVIMILIFYKYYKNSYKVIILSLMTSLGISSLLAIVVEKEIWKFKGKIETNKNEILKYSLPFTFSMALTWILSSSDKFFIKNYSSLNELGLYAGAFKLISLLTIIQNGFYAFWSPVVYEKYSKNPENIVFFKKATEYLSLLFFSLGVVILSTKDIVIMLLGKNYYNSVFIVPMLVFIPIMQLICVTTEIGIILKKESKYFIYTSGLIAVINVIGNILLIPKLGAKGAAISTGISYIILFYLRTYFSNKLINFGFDLKRIYLVIFLIFIYAMYLTFYNKIYFTILGGLLLEILILLIYLPILKNYKLENSKR
ncbi:O-antigen/teichoic acid export membrane protein [Fusobacterium sp. PH5-7]|uniref:lipopolysaccharide biosynthesis protein n=1 Tax=Fusobacterium sp. PH5-7 TaxID=2940528 RepID=UPI00247705EA|nr:oligosaccharide flippase family protein [Fusobacterium sp. PH5-7]MDH6457280.1 O-antigen/teichoic acid export membrane protein [Fusobacterium sp. PH5-7]